MKLTESRTKTDVVRQALLAQVEAAEGRLSLLSRLQPILSRASKVGHAAPDFEMKAFTNSMWEE